MLALQEMVHWHSPISVELQYMVWKQKSVSIGGGIQGNSKLCTTGTALVTGWGKDLQTEGRRTGVELLSVHCFI